MFKSLFWVTLWIMNSCQLLPISSNQEALSVLSPSMILTQKGRDLTSPMNITGFGPKDALRSQWKLVQNSLIRQLPWATFKVDDAFLVKDDCSHRNTWLVGIIKEVFPSKAYVFRKVMISVVRDDVYNAYVRPITELIHLLDCEWYAICEQIVDVPCLNRYDSIQLFS